MPAAPDTAPFSDDELEGLFRLVGAPISRQDARGAVLAVSGGSDSLGLLLLIKRWRDASAASGVPSMPLVVVSIDHGLRPEASDEARHVASICDGWGFEHVIRAWTGDKPATGLQEAARDARYRLLVAEADRRGVECIVTAHTLDDQAETVLMRLARGSGVKGLTGMAAMSFRDGVALCRPLLGVPRSRLRAALTVAGVSWIEDPSNGDARFLRPRLRAVMPALAVEGLDAARFAEVARKLRRADDAIEHAVRAFFSRHVVVEDVARGADGGAVVTSVAAHWFGADPTGVSGQPQRPVGAERHVSLDLTHYCCEAIEPAMRILARAIAAVAATAEPIGDAALERLADDIDTDHRHDRPLRRTLGGALIDVREGVIRVTQEPPRRARSG